MHARITQLDNGQFMIEDLTPHHDTWVTNPLMVGEVRVLAPTVLPIGSRVRVGKLTLPWTVDR